MFSHGITFGGHPTMCAIALKNIEIMKRERIVEHVLEQRGRRSARRSSTLLDLPIVGDVRGTGFFYAIELVKDKDTRETFSDDECERLLRGFLSPALFERRADLPGRRSRRPGDPDLAAARSSPAGVRPHGRDPRGHAQGSRTAASLVATTPNVELHGAPLEKGLKTGAIGFVSSVVIGVASTAPGYSLAASLGFVVIAVGFQAPAALLVAFVPMFLIAGSYYSMNRVDPDCGTSFTWVTKGIGPKSGWIAGWALLLADILVMASLSQIAGQYTFLLFGADDLAASVFWVTVVGVVWIVVMTWICYIGIELSARTQWFLLGAEIVTLALFVVIALWKVYAGDFPDSVNPSLSWLNPFEVSATEMTAGVLACDLHLLGLGHRGCGERGDRGRHAYARHRSGVVSTLLLLGIYIGVSYAAIAVHGPQFLVDNADEVLNPLGQDVMPYGLDKLLIIAILTSASASTQTTILPGTRAALSMAAHGAAPKRFASIHPRPSHARVRDDRLRRHLGRLLRHPDDGEREHPQRLDHGDRADDRLLSRHHGRRLRHLLPQGALQRPADVCARGARSRAGSPA